MGGKRALTKFNNDNDGSVRRNMRKRVHKEAVTDQSQSVKKEKELKLVELTREQEDTREVRFVFNQLPTTKEALATLLFDELKGNPNSCLIALQRIREYYNPALM